MGLIPQPGDGDICQDKLDSWKYSKTKLLKHIYTIFLSLCLVLPNMSRNDSHRGSQSASESSRLLNDNTASENEASPTTRDARIYLLLPTVGVGVWSTLAHNLISWLTASRCSWSLSTSCWSSPPTQRLAVSSKR